jgi:hypothetical protein
MKKFYFLVGSLLCISLQAQILNENFDNGIPIDWTQWSSANLTWTLGVDLGISGSDCAMLETTSSLTGDAFLQTPFFDLSTYQDVEIFFSVALIRDNFIAPDGSIWYDVGAGWQMIADFGGSSTGFQITAGFDATHPLDSSVVTWTDLAVALDDLALPDVSNIRFSFGGQSTNGGWVLYDNVEITHNGTIDPDPDPDPTAVAEKSLQTAFFPNPVSSVLTVSSSRDMYELKVFNLLGELVQDHRFTPSKKYELYVAELPEGMYLVEAYGENGYLLTSQKFIRLQQ